MKNLVKYLAISLLLSTASYVPAVNAEQPINVLVIDSGSDFEHDGLQKFARPNEKELNGQVAVDDDKNGYKDDIYGWNFVENNNTLVNLENTPPKYDEVLECMRILGIMQAYGKEALTKEEFSYLVERYQNKEFWAWVGFTGGWAHGTHCAGIITTDNPVVKLNAIRHIPTGEAPAAQAKSALDKINHMLLHKNRRSRSNDKKQKVTLDQLKAYFKQLGGQYAAGVKEKAQYIASLNPRVVNCSFGSENGSLVQMIKQNMAQWGFQNPTDAQVQEVVNLFVENAFLPRDKALFSGLSNALICIAAGNSSEDLDPLVTSPNNVKITNKLVVAATDNNKKLADFSCYGKTTVDVAVPGVNIYATYPNQKMGYMSGTSMACPMAAKFASYVFNSNPDLTPQEVKKILMETVDKKEWLKDKVISGGVINPNRAIFVAKEMRKGKDIDAAIKTSRTRVGDMVTKSINKFKGPDMSDPQVRELYFSAIF